MAANNQQAQARDFVKEYIDLAYDKCKKSKHRAQMHMDRFQNVILVTVTVYDREQCAWFVDGMPTFGYWLTRETREPFVAKMYKEGYSGIRIAKMLKVSPSTVYKDLKHIAEVSPFQVDLRITKRDLKPSKTLVPEGEFRLAALNALSQRAELNAAFKGVDTRTMTMQ